MNDSGPRNRSMFSRCVSTTSEIFGYASAALVLASMLIITYAAVLRYVVGASTKWQTELSIYFLMFAAFGGAAYGLKHGDHVNMNLVVVRLPARARHVARLVAAVLGFVLMVVIAVMAFDEWWETTQAGRRSGTAWNPPLTIPHLILPLGMTLLALQYLVVIAELIARVRSGATGEPVAEATDPRERTEAQI